MRESMREPHEAGRDVLQCTGVDARSRKTNSVTAPERSCVRQHDGLKRIVMCAAVSAAVWLAPGLAFAQATITGVVKDASGAVLPGVTVEAASPALIEKVRTAISDG